MKKPGELGHHHPAHVRKKISRSLKAINRGTARAGQKLVGKKFIDDVQHPNRKPKKTSKMKYAAIGAGAVAADSAMNRHILHSGRRAVIEEGRNAANTIKRLRYTPQQKAFSRSGRSLAKKMLRYNIAENVARAVKSSTARRVGKAAMNVLKFGVKRI